MTNTTNLGIPEPATNQTNKEVVIATALNDLDIATQSEYALTFVSNALTLTGTVYNRNFMFKGGDVGGNLTANGTLTVPSNNREFAVWNDGSVWPIVITTGITLGANATVQPNTLNNIYSDGTNVVANSVTQVFDIIVSASPFLNNGTINNGQTVTAATIAAQSLIGNKATIGAVPTALSISSKFTINASTGTLDLTTGTLDLTGITEVKVPAPVNASDAVTKTYADAAIQGLSIKPTAVVATTTTLPAYTYANGTAGVGATLTGTSTGTLTIDGHLTALNDVILVKNELTTNQPNNGLYRVTTAGAVGVAYVLTREIDMDSSSEFTGALIAVGEVSVTYPGTMWICNQTAPTVGTTNIGFTQISAAGGSSQWTAGTVSAISANFTIISNTLSLAPTLDLTGLTEVKVPVGANATDAVQKTYVDTAVGTGLILQGYLSGCQITTASTTTFTVGTGQVMSDDNTTMMTLGSALTKSTAGTWVVGNSSNGLDTGTIANTTWYHVWVIYRPDTGVTDVLLSASATSPTLPTNYTKKRRIGSQRTGSGAALFTILQNGDRFDLVTQINSVNSTIPGTSAVTQTLFVPTGVVVEAIITATIVDGPNSEAWFSSLAQADTAVATTTALSLITGNASATAATGEFRIMTNTSGQIRTRASSATQTLFINTNGWIDKRGASSGGGASQQWTAGSVTNVGNGLAINSGTISAVGTLAYTGTAAGTVTIAPTSGVTDVILNMPASGGTVTVAVTPAYAYQDWRFHIKQGATAGVANLNTGFVFAPSGGPSSFTLTPTANARDILWNQSVDGTHAVVGAILQGLTI